MRPENLPMWLIEAYLNDPMIHMILDRLEAEKPWDERTRSSVFEEFSERLYRAYTETRDNYLDHLKKHVPPVIVSPKPAQSMPNFGSH